ncbi:Na+/H+ antiporter NhaA [Allonocardiopsis opalescens]|uniref:Na(+)/H(+) antiporter NhaA n=1 Tax=Allonocardiopsis opalescens TaxID=1144618 RepID=A0A2T0Q1H5_9ACTN|nr:Na+/H+ antiporter NhaA [Allonocardiopsis opalescens]PRX97653.1 sodium/proton antiporter (NhaA family) [Allonocardiopsis opalescens]
MRPVLPPSLRRGIDALRNDAVGGFLLIGAAALALVWANSPWRHSYAGLRELTIGPAALHLDLSLETWAADGLLAVFFFIVGNELKQEFTKGELRDPRRALVPIVAAVSGMAVPALVYTAVTFGDPGLSSGWGIPMATDIAFALAVLAIVGRGLPPALRTFLLTLAIVDDFGAVLVIAVFYTDDIAPLALAGALAALAVFGYLQRGRGLAARLNASRVPNWLVYLPLAALIWILTHESGVHATIAGAAMGLLMRTSAHRGESTDPSHRLERLLRPVSAGIALPVFAFFAAGVSFTGGLQVVTDRVALGIIAGLVIGKLVGILGGAWLTTRLTRAHLDPSLTWWDIAGISQLAGIGFTVSLLIADLSFTDEATQADARAGVLTASLVAAALASVILAARARLHGRTREPL